MIAHFKNWLMIIISKAKEKERRKKKVNCSWWESLKDYQVILDYQNDDDNWW